MKRTILTIILACSMWIGSRCVGQTQSICGPSDDRRPLKPPDPFLMRIVDHESDGKWASGFMISENWMLTAHHITSGLALPWKVERNVPPSNFLTGQIRHPGPEDEFEVPDLSTSITSGDSTPGNDWAVIYVPNNAFGSPGMDVDPQFNCEFQNTTSGAQLTVDGFGWDTQNRRRGVLQTHSGPSISGGVLPTHVQYLVDTHNSSSGSRVTDEEGKIVGIHNRGNCTAPGGSNFGTLIWNDTLVEAIDYLCGFRICTDFSPVLSDIPNQTIDSGSRFTAIKVDNYVIDADDPDSSLTWTWSGNSSLELSWEPTRRRIIVRYPPGWVGGDTITFTANDPDGNSDSDDAAFSVDSQEGNAAWPLVNYDVRNSSSSDFTSAQDTAIAWEVSMSNSHPILLGEDDVCYTATDSFGTYTVAISSSGQILWTGLYGEPRAVIGGDTILARNGHVLNCIDSNGDLLWSRIFELDLATVTTDDASIYVALGWNFVAPDSSYKVYALNLDGSTKWIHTVNSLMREYSNDLIAVSDDRRMYVTTMEGLLISIDADSGKRLWTTQAHSLYIDQGPMVGSDGLIYVAQGPKLYSFNQSGERLWDYTTGGLYYSQNGTGLAEGSDGRIYALLVNEALTYTLHSFEPTGVLNWELELSFGNFPCIVIGRDNTIYVGLDKVYAIDATAQIKWQDDAWMVHSLAIGQSGNLYASSSEGLRVYGRLNTIDSVASRAQNSAAGLALPKSVCLLGNYPNPFNPVTIIKYELPKDARVSLRVYDVLGKEVITLADGHFTAGYHEVTLDASNLATGIYFYRLTSGAFTDVKKILVVK